MSTELDELSGYGAEYLQGVVDSIVGGRILVMGVSITPQASPITAVSYSALTINLARIDSDHLRQIEAARAAIAQAKGEGGRT